MTPDGEWKLYGGDQPAYLTSEEDGPRLVWMWRKGQQVKFLDDDRAQVGPLHRNVAPAVVWAAVQGWIDPACPDLSVAVIAEVRGKLANP